MKEKEELIQTKPSTAKRFVGILSLIIFLGLMVAVTVFIGLPVLEKMFATSDLTDLSSADFTVLRQIVAERPFTGRLVYIGIQVFIALIPGEVVEIAGGIAFNPFEGLLLSLIGVAIGSAIIFLFTKKLGMKFVSLFISQEKLDSSKFLHNSKKLGLTTFFLFLVPGLPKDVLTYIIGLTPMKLHTFLLITLIARIPSILSSTLGGDAIVEKDWKAVFLIFGITGGIALAGMVSYLVISKKRAAKKTMKQNDNAGDK